MKRLVLGAILLLFVGVHFAAANDDGNNSCRIEDDHGKKILVGKVSAADIWENIPEWKGEYVISEPDSAVVSALKNITGDYRIVCVMGIWCSDSRAGVPPFIKALDMAGNPHLKLEMYAVSRQIKDDVNARRFGVERVPTFIIYSGEKELGRMVEIPQTTFEADLVELIEQHKLPQN